MKCSHCLTQNIDTARFCEACGKSLTGPAAPDNLSAMQTIDPAMEAARPQPDSNSPLDLQPGQMLVDRYRIVAELGRGGMGVVYRAHDTVTDRDVALKLIRGDRLAGKDAVKRLIREGVLARDIRHPNVIGVYDVGEISGMPFLSMELLEGGSLRAWMQKQMREGRECSMAAAAHVVREVLAGLGAAHAQGVIHRDLKPENIILLSEPSDSGVKLKILDFGIARAAGGSETGATSLGTLEYMSPEQMTAPEAVQASADFYSLSVMFYELLIGVVPKGHWQPPSGGRGDVPPAIDKLIERGLSNAPRLRPQTAEQYRTELEAALAPARPVPAPQPEPLPAPKPEPSPQPQPQPIPRPSSDAKPKHTSLLTPGRVKLTVIAGCATLALGAIAIAAMVFGGQQQQTPPVQTAGNFDPPPNAGPGGNTITPEPDDDDPPPSPPPPPQAAQQNPPPNPANYPILSGYWIDDFGNNIATRVTRDGVVSGQVNSGPLVGHTVYGEFDGVDFAYSVSNAYGPVAASFGEWVDICHIQYAEMSAIGQPTGRIFTIHVNHFPQAPCS